MEFRLLGKLEIVEDGSPIRLDRRLSRAVLAYLLLHANEPVSADRLLDELWGPRPPRTAMASLQNYVSRIRKALGADRLRLEPSGYVLRVDPELFDVTRFERLVGEASASPPKQRIELLRSALSLWRGEPLEDLAFEDFAQAEIAHLVERRLTAVEERIDAELELGSGAELVGELEALVHANPLRARLRRQLMLALYRADRQAEALDAYRDARKMLRDELGLEPSEDLRALERAILRQEPSLRAEANEERAPADARRTVTVVFCDLLAHELDPEAHRRLLSPYVDAVRSAVETHGGVVAQLLGDAVLGLFGVQELHEDDALRAVRAAVDIRESARRLDDRVEVRVGVNTGEVVLTASERGPAVSLASGLARRAGPGEIVLADETRRLVRDAILAEALDAGEKASAWLLDALLPAAPGVARRLEAPFVGRKEELRRVLAAFRRACREQSSSVVTFVGEAGIGKTRLVGEFVASVAGDAHILVGRCVPYGAGATYLPLREIVGQAAPEESVAGIASLLPADPDAELVARRVAELVGMAEGAPAIGEGLWAVRRLLEAIARAKPLIAVLDDLHWAEPTLLDLVEYLGGWAEAPMLVVCAARPDLLEARVGWGGPSSTGFVVELEPLPAASMAALVGELAAGAVDTGTLEQIVARAGGNPLFAEQLLALSAEAPDLSLDRAPPTVEALIATRLERLDAQELAVLRRASVIGRRFTHAEAEQLGPITDSDLLGLERKGLIHPTDAGFSFHHVLVRDVAYRGLTKAERAELHERVAEALEKSDGPDELIGYHLEQAFAYRVELAPVDDRARQLGQAAGDWLGTAGLRAWKRGDAPAAQNLLGRAAALPEGEQSRAPLLCELGVAVWAAGDPDRAAQIFREAVATASAVGDRGSELRARLERANLRLFHGEDGAADELLGVAAEAVLLFEQLGDDRSLGRAWLLVSYVEGGLRCGYAASLQAAELAREHSIRAGWPASTQQVAAALFHGPTPAGRAIARCEALLEDADRLGEAHVFAFLGGLWTMTGRVDEGRRFADAAEYAYKELGLTVPRATTLAPQRAEIEMLAGYPSAAEQILRESCEAFERMGERVHLATQAAQLADVLYGQGEYEEAERWTHTAEANTSANDVSAQLSWRAVRAKTRARAGDAERGEALARAAVALAEKTDALNHHARVLLDLVEVLRLGDRADEASTYVAQAIGLLERKENDLGVRHARALHAKLAIA